MEGGRALLERQKIQARLDKTLIAQAMAVVVKALLSGVEAEQDDYWVNVDLSIHFQDGKALEKHARINVYGDLVDPYATDIFGESNYFKVPSEVLNALKENSEK
jgi:hypothetical protein